MANSRYRNTYLDNHTHFCTASIIARLPLLSNERARRLIFDSWNRHRVRYPVLIEAFVIMPDHVHLLVRGLADNTRQFMQYFLAETSRKLRVALESDARAGDGRARSWLSVIMSRANGRATGKVWKERFRCLAMDHADAVIQKMDYIHRNPVKDELVANVDDWPWSSYSHYAGKECVFRVDEVFDGSVG